MSSVVGEEAGAAARSAGRRRPVLRAVVGLALVVGAARVRHGSDCRVHERPSVPVDMLDVGCNTGQSAALLAGQGIGPPVWTCHCRWSDRLLTHVHANMCAFPTRFLVVAISYARS